MSKSSTNYIFFLQLFSVLVGFALSSASFSQVTSHQEETALPESIRGCLGIYEINLNNKPREFKNFQSFQLEEFSGQDPDDLRPNSKGIVSISGKVKLVDNTKVRFATASVTEIKNGEQRYYKEVQFRTSVTKGVSYKFEGAFLENTILEERGYTVIKGRITKYEKGRKIASMELPFTKNAEL